MSVFTEKKVRDFWLSLEAAREAHALWLAAIADFQQLSEVEQNSRRGYYMTAVGVHKDAARERCYELFLQLDAMCK